MFKRKLLSGLIAGSLVAMAAGAVSAEPLKIRIQWSVTPAHMTPLLPHAPKGVYKHWGKSYVMEPTRMRGSGPALQAVAAGEIEFGGMSVQALTLGVKRARLDLTVIAQIMSGGVKGWASSEFMVRDDGAINSFKDVKGKIVAVNAFGGTIDAAIRAMASRAGLVPAKDFQLVEVRFPAMLPALQSKRIDLTVLVTPFNLIAMKKGGFKKLFTMGDALGATETLQWIGKASFVKKNRAALVDFLEDNLRFRQWAYDPKNRDQLMAIISKVTKRPAKNYASWAFTHKDNFRHPLALTNVKRMQRNLDDLNKLGVMKQKLDVSKHIDMSLAKEAAKRLTSM